MDWLSQIGTFLLKISILEYIAVATGIVSVWFSKKENFLVYPFGLISTAIYIYLSWKYELIGEASVNLYYTIMSIIGWWLWIKKEPQTKAVQLQISFSTKQEKILQFGFFLLFLISLYLILLYFEKKFSDGVIPWADAFATATAFTGMYLMVKKKVESWYWWAATNMASIPLYAVKTLYLTSFYYVILLVLTYYGFVAWRKKAIEK